MSIYYTGKYSFFAGILRESNSKTKFSHKLLEISRLISNKLYGILNTFAFSCGRYCVVIMSISWTGKYSFFGGVLRETNSKTKTVA